VWYDHLSRKPAARAEFDFDRIERLLREVAAHNKAWQQWLAANQIEPLAIRYEDLASDQIDATQRALAFLGVEIPDAFRIVEQTRRQRDALNDEWIKRFHELASAPPKK
jgi:LPS sulfotransferase NodH